MIESRWDRLLMRRVYLISGSAVRILRLLSAPIIAVLGSITLATTGHAGTIFVPNGSFEGPQTTFADPRVDSWQKAPEPAWYQGGGGFPWDQLIGQFLNTTNGSSDHIDNMDASQAVFLFALPDVALFQDYNSLSGSNTAPSHQFTALFDAGKSYALTVGLLGGGGGMSNGATFQISMYYRDASNNPVTVAATVITNTAALFPTNSHFTDFQVRIPSVQASDAWAGKNIGIRLASAVGFDLQGGYWDVDNVRLNTISAPMLTNVAIANGQTRFTLQSAPGRFEILSSTDIGLPSNNWTSLGVVTNVTGSFIFTDTNANAGFRFYQARQSP